MAFTKVTNTGIGSTGTVLLQNLNVTGIVTAGFGVSTVDVFTTGITSFANTTDSTSSTTGSVIVSGGVGIAGSLNVGGSVSVGGTLTYEDVTNVDSVGIITARSGIKVGSGITLSPDGDSFATGVTTVGSLDVTTGFVKIPDSIIHVDDSDTKIRFPGNDQISFETGGTQRMIIGSGGAISITDTIQHTGDTNTKIRFPIDDHVSIETGGVERFRIDNSGLVGIGASSTGARLHISDTGTDGGIRLVDGSQSSGSPNLEIIAKRVDSNVNTSFSANIYLGKNRTDQKLTDGMRLGSINFGGNHTDGTEDNISYAAAIRGQASGDFDSKSDMPTDLVFTTGVTGTDRTGEAASSSNVGTERLRITSAGELLVNEDSANTYVDGAGYSQTPKLQVISNTSTDTAISLRYNSGAAASARRASFIFARTADGASVSNDSVLGEVVFMGEANSTLEKAASIRANVDGTPGENDMPGRLVFSTTADGSDSLAERLRISSNGKILIGSGTMRNIGGAAALGHLQIEGTTGNTSSVSLINNQNNSGGIAVLRFAKTRGTSDGAVTTVADGDSLGAVSFTGADGTDLLNTTAQIRAVVNGTVAGNQIPTDILFETSATDGSSISERARITRNGDVLIGGTNEIPDTQVAINGNIAQYNSGTGTGAAIKTFALAKTYSMSTSATNILTFDNWGTSAFDITVFRKDTAAPAGAQVVKVYLAFHGSGTNITQASIAQENKVLRGSIHNIDYTISENNNTATLIATGDNNGGETQTLVFHILAHGNSGGQITVV
tara:strand:+ start:1225 stop:3567 length:2343 start_codon:yes stop_codon:yes gene_type:complete